MTPKDFSSIIAKNTGKFVNIARARKLFKLYSPEEIERATSKLLENPTPHLIPDPISYIQRILSVENNKQETQQVMNSLWDN